MSTLKNKYSMTVTWDDGRKSSWLLENVLIIDGSDPIDLARKRAVMVLDGIYGPDWPSFVEFNLTLLDREDTPA